MTRNILALALVLAFAAQVRIVPRVVRTGMGFCDYANFYVWGEYLDGGGNPYVLTDRQIEQVRAESVAYSCGLPNQSPALYGLISLLRLEDFRASARLWTALSLIAFGACVFVILRACGYSVTRNALQLSALVLAVQSSWVEGLALGQTAMIVTLLLAMMLLALRRSFDFSAACSCAAIGLLKINLIPIGIVFLALRKWKAAAAAAAVYLITLAVASMGQGTAVMGGYIRRASGTGFRPSYGFDPLDISIANTVHSLLETPAHPERAILAHGAVLSLTGAVLVLSLYVLSRKPKPETLNLCFALVLTTVLLISPVLEVIYLLFLVIAFIIVIREILPAANMRRQAMFAFAFVVIAAGFSLSRFPQFHSGPGILLANIKLLGVALMWWVQLTALWRKTPSPA